MYMCSYDVCFKLLCTFLSLNFRFLLYKSPSCHVVLRLVLPYQRQFFVLVVKSSSPRRRAVLQNHTLLSFLPGLNVSFRLAFRVARPQFPHNCFEDWHNVLVESLRISSDLASACLSREASPAATGFQSSSRPLAGWPTHRRCLKVRASPFLRGQPSHILVHFSRVDQVRFVFRQ